MSTTHPPHLRALEAESIHIIREAAAESENPVLLYSIGKDSSVLLHLALKAFGLGLPVEDRSRTILHQGEEEFIDVCGTLEADVSIN